MFAVTMVGAPDCVSDRARAALAAMR